MSLQRRLCSGRRNETPRTGRLINNGSHWLEAGSPRSRSGEGPPRAEGTRELCGVPVRAPIAPPSRPHHLPEASLRILPRRALTCGLWRDTRIRTTAAGLWGNAWDSQASGFAKDKLVPFGVFMGEDSSRSCSLNRWNEWMNGGKELKDNTKRRFLFSRKIDHFIPGRAPIWAPVQPLHCSEKASEAQRSEETGPRPHSHPMNGRSRAGIQVLHRLL